MAEEVTGGADLRSARGDQLQPQSLTNSASPSPDPDSKSSRHFIFDFIGGEGERSDVGDPSGASRVLTEALQEENAFLDYLRSLPLPISASSSSSVVAAAVAASVANNNNNSSSSNGQQGVRERSRLLQKSMSRSSMSNPKVGLDHLDNLCKLMEQLGELKDQNTKLQRRIQYLEDMRNLQEMHKELQEVLQAKTRQPQQPQWVTSSGGHHQSQGRKVIDLTPSTVSEGPSPVTTPHLHQLIRRGSQESLPTKCPAEAKRTDSKPKAHQSKFRKSLMKYRERSKSVGHEDMPLDPRVPTITSGAQPMKAKVSKWTKVKEALKWDKVTPLEGATATISSPLSRVACNPSEETVTRRMSAVPLDSPRLTTPENKSQDSGIGQLSESGARFLKVPNTPEAELSASPADSVLSGHSFSMSFSSHRSSRVMPPGGTTEDAGAPSGGAASYSSSSSSSEDLPSLNRLNANDSGYQRTSSATDSVGHLEVSSVVSTTTVATTTSTISAATTADVTRRSKSLESDDAKDRKKPPKSAWGRVKNIIQTRKDSLKRRHRKSVVTGCEGDGAGGVSVSISYPSDQDVEEDEEEDEEDADEEDYDAASCDANDGKPDDDEYVVTPSSRKRLTPQLTVTIPSTEELHTLVSRTAVDDRPDASRGVSSTGCSPPAPRRPSKWTKVKKAFLTSAKTKEEETSMSAPSSPNRTSMFVYEGHDPIEEAEIQRNYEELQVKLSQEFQKKMHEWDSKRKGSGKAGQASHKGDDLAHDKEFRKKMQEWERIKGKGQQGGQAGSPQTAPADGERNLSPDFKKKLHEWQKMKGAEDGGPTVTTTATPATTTVTTTTGSKGRRQERAVTHQESLPPDFRKRLDQWEIWKAVSGKSPSNVEELQKKLPLEFNRKLQEWERIKAHPPAPGGNQSGCSSSGPSSTRSSHKSKKSKREGAGSGAGPGAGPGEKPREKELQWLERELHKIEREKLRLEREREKFLEREARLEKMREAMKNPHQGRKKQEVLIKTSRGEFRFEGISQKFTKKLYEWEERRGIGPESSTIALLDPNYRPRDSKKGKGGSTSAETSRKQQGQKKYQEEQPAKGEVSSGSSAAGGVGTLTRSKSESSVVDLVALSSAQGQSRLSLARLQEDADSQADTLQEARAASEPHLSKDDARSQRQPSPETSPSMTDDTSRTLVSDAPSGRMKEVSIFSYAPSEITKLIDSTSSGSDEGDAKVQRSESVRTESSYKLIEENMSLLDKLKRKEDICRKLESEMESLGDSLVDVERTHQKELERLKLKENGAGGTTSSSQSTALSEGNQKVVEQLRCRIQELETRGNTLRKERESLQNYFEQHSEQQAALAQSLVAKMRQLQEANHSAVDGSKRATCTTSTSTGRWRRGEDDDEEEEEEEEMEEMEDDEDDEEDSSCQNKKKDVAIVQQTSLSRIRQISSELLQQAQRLELALMERNREIRSLRLELRDRQRESSAAQSRAVAGGRRVPLSYCTNRRYWASADGVICSRSKPNEDQDDVGHEDGLQKSGLMHQESLEIAQLPSALTNKVQELKQELVLLCSSRAGMDDSKKKEASCSGGGSTQTVTKGVYTVPSNSDELCTTFVVKVRKPSVKHDPDAFIESTRCHKEGLGMVMEDETASSSRKSSEEVQMILLPCPRKRSSVVSSSEDERAYSTDRESAKDTESDDDDPESDKMTNKDVQVGQDVNNAGDPDSVYVFTLKPSTSSKRPDDSSEGDRRKPDDDRLTYPSGEDEVASAKSDETLTIVATDDEKPSDAGLYHASPAMVEEMSKSTPDQEEEPSQQVVLRRDNSLRRPQPSERDVSGDYSSTKDMRFARTFSQTIYDDEEPSCGGGKVNPLVPTTRCIFSPVHQDSQGQASSAISMLLKSISQESECGGDSSATPPVPQWRRRPEPAPQSPLVGRRRLPEPNRKLSWEPFVSQSPFLERKERSNQSCSPSFPRRFSDKSCLSPSLARRKMEQRVPWISQHILEERGGGGGGEMRGETPVSTPTFSTPPTSPPTTPSPASSRKKKETSPSVRLMVARYNQKLTEQEGVAAGGGTSTPESRSPIWRSPVAERKLLPGFSVRAQMERYQEEVRKALGRSEVGEGVQKSASAGIIKSAVNSLKLLKSSSAGSVPKCSSREDNSTVLPDPTPAQQDDLEVTLGVIKESSEGEVTAPSPARLDSSASIDATLQAYLSRKSPVPTEEGPPPLSPTSCRLRALKLKKARDEFLHGPQRSSPSPKPDDQPDDAATSAVLRIRPSGSGLFRQRAAVSKSEQPEGRLSQISMGSESSFDDDLTCARDGLVKSASLGVIGRERVMAEPGGVKSSSLQRDPEPQPAKRSGFFDLAARFKVKFRRKEPRTSMSTVARLCRQSLMVDISAPRPPPEPSSKSYPSSPLLLDRPASSRQQGGQQQPANQEQPPAAPPNKGTKKKDFFPF